ncbi:MAG: CRTAC1 family protein [Phycisphaeraceae bacterium]|nr:MAG: CRTAC1 family protein [Phycisphaeraceae bacterium]
MSSTRASCPKVIACTMRYSGAIGARRFERGARLPAMLLACAGAAHAHAQTVIDGVAFIDRTFAGDIAAPVPSGAVSVIDFDNDGWPDLIVGGRGGEPNRLLRNVPDPQDPSVRTLIDVTIGSGLDDDRGVRGTATGIVVADYNNDGYQDVFVTGREIVTNISSLLYRNNGNGTFTNVSVEAGVLTSGENTWAAGWSDFDLDGDLDLLIGSNGGPRALRLLRNRGDGTFEDATSMLPPVSGVNTIYSLVWTDIDDDGDPDCLVLSAGFGALLIENVLNADGSRSLINASAARGFTKLGPAPMGINIGDIDNDGDRDIAITTGAVGTYYRNDGGVLTLITPFETFWGWGTTYLDVDNDGDLDHYQCGSLGQGPNHDALIRNDGVGPDGSVVWTDISEAMNSTFATSQHASRVDLNNDGRIEIVSQNPSHYLAIYENISMPVEGAGGASITIKARGDGVSTNRDAIGAVVRATATIRGVSVTQTREITSGSSTTSTEDMRAHFGLGDATSVDAITITWPRFGHVHARTDTYTGPFAPEQILEFVPRCAADVNKDDSVDILDFLDYLDAFGGCVGSPGPCGGSGGVEADFDGIGTVDIVDLLKFLDGFSTGC